VEEISMGFSMLVEEVLKGQKVFTKEQKQKVIEYLQWYTCFYRKEQLEKMTDQKLAQMYKDTENMVKI
jgi:hypothetical protein